MHTRENGPVAAAILAGGLARRMGGITKAALRVGDRRIVDRQLALLRQVADPVFIVSGHPDVFTGLEPVATIIPDVLPGAGPLGGIYTAIVSSPHCRTLVVACDMPFLTRPLLDVLCRPTDADLVVPRTSAGYEPLCAVWSAACARPVRRRIEEARLKVADVLDDLRVEEVGPSVLAAIDPAGRLFVNVNTPHDYERAERFARAEASE